MSLDPSLRALITIAHELTARIIESGGELEPDVEHSLSILDAKIPAAVDASGELMSRLAYEAEYWKAKADQYSAIAKGLDRAAARVKETIKTGMALLDVTELKGRDIKFKLSNSRPRLILDETSLDRAYFTQRTVIEPDRKRIEEDLKLGVDVEGASLVETKSLRTYANREVKSDSRSEK